MTNPSGCREWKEIIPRINPGGFDCSRHPSLMKIATINAKTNFSENGYFPDAGSTQVYKLASKILPLIKNESGFNPSGTE